MADLSNANVLVVDDEESYQEIYQRRLESRVRKLCIVDNRAAALDVIKRQFFHAAILDIRLEDTNPDNEEGMAVAKAIHALGESTGLVMVSGFGTTKRVRDAFHQYGAVDFLDKAEYTPGQLYEALEEAVATSETNLEVRREHMLEMSNLVRQTNLAILTANMPYAQQQSLSIVLTNLVRPILPIQVLAEHEKIIDNVAFETKYWSRLDGCAYCIRIGPRTRILAEVDELKRTGSNVTRYTMSSFSGLRFRDDSVSAPSFGL